MHEAVCLHEESLRLYRMARELKKRESLLHVLRAALEVAEERYTVTHQENEFDEPVLPPAISGTAAYAYLHYVGPFLLARMIR